eukprot:1196268-Prorocentrum_minimum.AAC.4
MMSAPFASSHSTVSAVPSATAHPSSVSRWRFRACRVSRLGRPVSGDNINTTFGNVVALRAPSVVQIMFTLRKRPRLWINWVVKRERPKGSRGRLERGLEGVLSGV